MNNGWKERLFQEAAVSTGLLEDLRLSLQYGDLIDALPEKERERLLEQLQDIRREANSN